MSDQLENRCDWSIDDPQLQDRIFASIKYVIKGFPDCTKCNGHDYLCPEFSNKLIKNNEKNKRGEVYFYGEGI